MASMKYCDKHNQVGFLKKPEESTGFAEIVDFLKGSHIRIYNFSKLILDGMVANLKSRTKFLMYPRFLQMILETQTENKHPYLSIVLTKKIFGNMKRGFRGVPRPLLPAMLPVVAVDQMDQPSPSEPLPSSSHPPVLSATTESEPTLVAEQITHPTSLTPEPNNSTHPHVAEERTMTVDDLLQLVPTLITKVDSLETKLKQTKLTMGKALVKLVKLVKKVKKMEDVLKRRQVVLPDSEDEDAEILPNRGGIYQEEGLDENVLRVKETRGKRFQGEKDIDTALKILVLALKIVVLALKTTKEQIQQEEASLAEAIRLQTLEEEETAKQVHLDALLAKRLAEEEELTEQQKKRKAQVQFEAQFYTEEDWDAIRAKLEANAELTKDVLGKDLSEQDFAKRMVDLVNQRKKHFAEERAKQEK
ncbi:hypothetical protein Tco_0726492 [Tanacetum coccineum]|uniref:Uncharacterized protein n=1 Tax=Tanacetum coccineum TaxID=301880 RepID=A0ABQ4YGM3_9ASTR